MAILSAVPPPSQQDPNIPLTAFALSQLSIGGTTLRIPLDEPAAKGMNGAGAYGGKKRAEVPRDSTKRREALLKGNEGSRRRRRWETANFLNVPNSQPPLPSDWEIHPTYPIHTVPYYLAPLWEAGLHKQSQQRDMLLKNKAKTARANVSGITNEGKGSTGKIPQELRTKLKKAKGAKGLLIGLETEIRGFASSTTSKRPASPQSDSESETFSDPEDEIVFIGRDPTTGLPITTSTPPSPARRHESMKRKERERQRKVYEGRVEEKEGGFARWLVHCLAEYYGLKSWSETDLEMRKRGVWVGFEGAGDVERGLPMPLWGLV